MNKKTEADKGSDGGRFVFGVGKRKIKIFFEFDRVHGYFRVLLVKMSNFLLPLRLFNFRNKQCCESSCGQSKKSGYGKSKGLVIKCRTNCQFSGVCS